MKTKAKGATEKISLENFDPLGPRDKVLNSPRSLEACEKMGVNPEELFILDKNELGEQLGDQKLTDNEKEQVHAQYIEQLEELLQKLVQIREDIISKGSAKKKGSKKPVSSKSKKDRSIKHYPESDELQVDEAKDDDNPANLKVEEPSEGAAMNSKLLYKKKKPRKKAFSKSVKPSKKTMEEFQRTQYLPSGSQMMVREPSYRDLDPMEKLQRVMEREQRRQKTMLQSYQNTEGKRQQLLQKMNEDLRKQQYYKSIKEGRLFLTVEERVHRILRGMERQARINDQLNRHKFMVMERQRQAEMIRKQKEEKAEQQLFINKMMKQAYFNEEEKQWAYKMNYIHNLKDIEEFKRGMTSATLEEKDIKFRNWL